MARSAKDLRAWGWLAGVTFLLGCTPASRVATSWPRLGDDRPSLVRKWGEPKAVFAPRGGHYYAATRRVEVGNLDDLTEDVYTQVYAGTEFEIGVRYLVDDSASRLHPTERVKAVVFRPDKRLSLRATLELIPQTKELCANGCTLLEEAALGTYDAYLYHPPTGLTREPVPALWAIFVDEPSEHGPLPNFNALSLDKVVLGNCYPTALNKDPGTKLRKIDWHQPS